MLMIPGDVGLVNKCRAPDVSKHSRLPNDIRVVIKTHRDGLSRCENIVTYSRALRRSHSSMQTAAEADFEARLIAQASLGQIPAVFHHVRLSFGCKLHFLHRCLSCSLPTREFNYSSCHSFLSRLPDIIASAPFFSGICWISRRYRTDSTYGINHPRPCSPDVFT